MAVDGNSQEAIRVLQAVEKTSWKTDALLANLLDNEDANVVIELTGYPEVKAVVVEFKGDYNFFHFMQKTPTGWRLRMRSSRKELKYCFYVAGERVIDFSQPILEKQETVKGDFAPFNTLKL